MRIIICLLIAVSAVFAQPSRDDAAVRGVVARYVAAREHSNEKDIAALFMPDADQLVSTGEWRKGKADVVKGTLASSQSNTGTRTITVESVRFLSPDVALADGRYEIATRKMWTSIILKRTAEGWRIAAIRNMLPAR